MYISGYEIGATIIQFITLLGLIYSLYLTRQEFTIRTRPYVGFVDLVRKDADNTRKLEFDVFVSNTGSVPAKNAKLYGKFEVEGEGEALFECETKGAIFPSLKELPSWFIGLKDVDRQAVLNGTKQLKLDMTIDYFGVSKTLYKTHSIRIYDCKRDKWVREEGDWT